MTTDFTYSDITREDALYDLETIYWIEFLDEVRPYNDSLESIANYLSSRYSRASGVTYFELRSATLYLMNEFGLDTRELKGEPLYNRYLEGIFWNFVMKQFRTNAPEDEVLSELQYRNPSGNPDELRVLARFLSHELSF